MTGRRYQSWGRYPRVDQKARHLYWRDDPLPFAATGDSAFLPFGNGRSYGDVCLNDNGALLDCRHLDRFILFDAATGLLRCEAGVLLSEILGLIVEKGWFLPVTPGTQFVTVGGAIANDIHGKNHHQVGTFGCHVRRFELVRSDGTRLVCSSSDNERYFRATIGGLGLTGVITWAEIQLHPIKSAFIDQETIRYRNIEEFFALAADSDQEFEHTVAWVDCTAGGPQLGRGLFIRGNYAEFAPSNPSAPVRRRLTFPFDPPFTLVNGVTLKAFNALYYRKQWARTTRGPVHYEPFFYPLDAVRSWNRVYGSRGFLQYQCAIPIEVMEPGIREILERIAKAGVGSFLAVLKLFGSVSSPGLLSFPLPGATLALDFPNEGHRTFSLLNDLDRITGDAGGRLYPAKDARMHADFFRSSFPEWQTLESLRDSAISSSFWRRVTETE